MTRTELGITYSESYVYDDGDNVLQCTYPTGRVVDYGRDGIRRVSSIASNGSSLVNSMSYRGDSQMIGRSWANNLQETRSYDLQARVTQIALGGFGSRDYSYDASSNVSSITSPFQTGNYDYDLNDRLTQEVLNTTGTSDYEYDLNDNRLRKLIDTTETIQAYSYLPNSNRLTSTDAVSEISTTASVIDRELTHNDADRIRSITIDNQVVGTYFYNDIGLRSRKELSNEDGSVDTTIYHYNMFGSLIAETSVDGQTQREYVWNGMEPIAQIDESGVTYLHSDHLYTTRLGTDNLQQAVWQWESQAFGNTEPQIEQVEMNLRFPGQYADAESGLYYNWNRYYDPAVGRYVTSDPIGLGGGLNTYGYVGGNPLRYYDPDGLKGGGRGGIPLHLQQHYRNQHPSSGQAFGANKNNPAVTSMQRNAVNRNMNNFLNNQKESIERIEGYDDLKTYFEEVLSYVEQFEKSDVLKRISKVEFHMDSPIPDYLDPGAFREGMCSPTKADVFDILRPSIPRAFQ